MKKLASILLMLARKLIDDTGRGQSEKTLKETGEVVLCKMKFFVYRLNFAKAAKFLKTKPGDDLQQLRWFNLDDVLNHKLAPPSRTFFNTKLHLLA